MAHHDKVADDEIIAILDLMPDGYTLKQACAQSGRGYWNIARRIHASEVLGQLYARAREEYAHHQVQKMHDIAVTEQDVSRARLRIDCIKWEASKVLPKVYGDRLELDGKLKHEHSILDAIRLAGSSGDDPKVEA